MIVAFVIDTSPSMGEPLQKPGSDPHGPKNGMSRLDLAKMAIESITKMLRNRVQEHNMSVMHQETQISQSISPSSSSGSGSGGGGSNSNSNQGSRSFQNLGFGYCPSDHLLLLSTGRQHTGTTQPASAACGAGGRLLVGFGHVESSDSDSPDHAHQQQLQTNIQSQEAFDRELKRLKASSVVHVPQPQRSKNNASHTTTFSEDSGGAAGLNTALSAGLQLLSRFRLQHRCTDNFGMGRLPCSAILAPTTGGGAGGTNKAVGQLQQASNALQPACLILLTDGNCLRCPQSEGGGPLQLQLGGLPLREFYREPFRWDQRIFCLGVGPNDLHSSLRALCEVTGGCHAPLRSISDISHVSEHLLRLISPPVPARWPVPNPLRLPYLPKFDPGEGNQLKCCVAGTKFVKGGPVVSMQQLEGMSGGETVQTYRAMLLFSPYSLDTLKSNPNNQAHQPPIWCIPESFFPSKKLDTLPPRTAQPVLHFSRHYQVVGSGTFDPMDVMKSLHRIDQLIWSNRQLLSGGNLNVQANIKLIQRDVYLCEWLCQDGKTIHAPSSQKGQEYFPVCVCGAGRNSLLEGDENVLNVGILHIPAGSPKLSTLTLLPPDPHILFPLLVKAAEVEHRALKKTLDKIANGPGQSGINVSAIMRNVHLDDNWRAEFRAYLFRIPPYYQQSLRRCLRHVLPASVHCLLSTDTTESIILQCFSRQCYQKIRHGEQFSKENLERVERREEEYRKQIGGDFHDNGIEMRYGSYDRRMSLSNYLAALRNMPPPWRIGIQKTHKKAGPERKIEESSNQSSESQPQIDICKSLGNLPHQGLLAFYESRRKWIFGRSGLTTRGLAIEGTNNDGADCHSYDHKGTIFEDSLLSLCEVGATSLNQTSISKMGDFKERLLWSRQPVVGYGSNDSTGSATTTAADGSPIWSADDDALPISFFDPKTGEFTDSVQTRIRARLMINFGNPYKDKRGDSLVPQNFINQRPPLQNEWSEQSKSGQMTPPGSPPHGESLSDGEDEANFAGRRPPSPSRRRDRDGDPIPKSNKKVKSNPQTREGQSDLSKQKRSNSSTVPMKPQPPPSNMKPPPPSSKPVPSSHFKPPSPAVKIKPPPPPSNLGANMNTMDQSNKTALQQTRHRPPPPPSKPQGVKKPPPPPPKQKSVVDVKQNTTSPEDLQSPNKKPKVNLPPGWISVWSKSQKRWYYFDQTTNKSVWVWPPPGGIR